MKNNGKRPIIGIIGGVGPYAGLDLVRKIYGATAASRDQDHLDLLMASCPRLIPDRTAYLLGNGGENPAEGILSCVATLYAGGARLFGIPCNTAHSERIMGVVRSSLAERYRDAVLVDMLAATGRVAAELCPGGIVGLLATKGTHRSGVYRTYLDAVGLTLIEPPSDEIEAVHRSIFDDKWGIKAQSDPPTEKACRILAHAARALCDRGAHAIILGCTEIPLALHDYTFDVPLIDAGLCLARELVRQTAPEMLRPMAADKDIRRRHGAA
jgi:aspartate racemase